MDRVQDWRKSLVEEGLTEEEVIFPREPFMSKQEEWR